MRKRSAHVPKGMVKDVSASKLGKDYYIDALNIRIAPNEDNTGFSITNIRSNALVQKFGGAQYIGHIVLDKHLVVFLKMYTGVNWIIDIQPEYIGLYKNTYELAKIGTGYKLLAEGDFGFDAKYPIEGIGIYEKEDVQKVYWIDGKNQPRYLNIVREDVVTDANELNFVKKLFFNEEISIERNKTTIGSISAGTMQYVLTYYNTYGAETNIFYTSPLYYISYNERGADPADTRISTSFSITVQSLDKTYEYLRIYSIHRTSIDATPEVKRVADLLTSNGSIAFVDDGTLGETVDPTLLLYVGGKSVIPNTMEQKDNTLFMGNYEEPNSLVCKDTKDRKEVKDLSQRLSISFDSDYKELEGAKFRGFYDYENQLQKSSHEITFYKFGETYRFGYQAQKSTGEWSEPIFITDAENTVPVQMTDSSWNIYKDSGYFTPSSDNGYKVSIPTTTLSNKLVEKLLAEGYVRVRPLVVFPELTDRTCICQGVLCPTVFNAKDRMDNAPYAQSSWFFRPNAPIDQDLAVGDGDEEDDDSGVDTGTSGISYESNQYYEIVTSSSGVSSDVLANCNGAYMKFKLYPLNSKDDTLSFSLPIKGYIQSGDYIGWYVDSGDVSNLDKSYLEVASSGDYPINTQDYPMYLVEINYWDKSTSGGGSSSGDNGDDDDQDDAKNSFVYDYNTFYNLKDYDAEGTFKASHLNNWVIYTVEGDDMCPNPDKTIQLVNGYDFSEVKKTGYLEECQVNDSGYICKGVKINWNDGDLSDTDLKDGVYTILFPMESWGDSNYRKWRADSSSVAASSCHVNPRLKLTFNIKSGSSETVEETETLLSTVFDFNDPTNLNPSATPATKDGEYVAIYNTEWTSEVGATLHINDAEPGSDNYLYTKIDATTGETSYYLKVSKGSKLILHSQEGVYARRIDIVDADTGKTITLTTFTANMQLMYTCIITSEVNISKVIYYYVDPNNTSSSKSATALMAVARSAKRETATAELAVYLKDGKAYPAIQAVKMPKITTKSGMLVWDAGTYIKSYYTISSRVLRTLGLGTDDTVTMRLIADTSLVDADGTTISNNYVTGTSTEFRHWYQIPNSNHSNAEIQCNFIGNYNLKQIENHGWQDVQEQKLNVDLQHVYRLSNKDGNSTQSVQLTSKQFRKDFADMFFIDQSIVTMHSPEIEFDTNTQTIDQSSLKLKLVGYAPITSTISDVNIKTSTIALNYWKQAVTAPGFLHSTVGSIGQRGYRGLNTDTLWWDEEWYKEISKNERENPGLYTTAYLTYPWHRSGSMNNQPSKSYTNAEEDSSEYRSAELERKVMSNLRTSFNSVYCYVDSEGNTQPLVNRLKTFNNEIDEDTETNLSGISLFDDDQVVNTRLKGQDDSIATINYYGNIDKVLASSRQYYLKSDTFSIGYPIFKGRRGTITTELSLNEYGDDDISLVFGWTSDKYETIYELLLGKMFGKPAKDKYKELNYYSFGTDPVLMKYKSSPHGVLALKYIDDHTVHILPTTLEASTNSRALNKSDYADITPFWDENKTLSVQQETIYAAPKYGYLWMGELQNTKHSIKEGKLVDDGTEGSTSVRFGGTSDSAIQNNTWLPAGDAVKLTNGVKLQWLQGDTYYQRYDCLKTYSFTTEDDNSIIDICSFMVETRVNIDGRYDRNRGQTSNLQMSPTIFNLINPVYSQKDNFFSYKVLDENLYNTTIYKNYITWSKKKTNGEEVDTWTNVTLANAQDLDGDKGAVRCLKLFNNNLLCFQDKAISQILYNEQTQISTTQGVPIEIANSDKVQGKRYITTDIGCQDKWTVKTTPVGLFFMDYLHPSIYLYTGEFKNLTESLGMSVWAHNNIGYGDKALITNHYTGRWYPYARKVTGNITKNRCFRTCYDPNTQDVYFIGTNGEINNNSDCLVFSTQLQQFIGFQSLGDTYMMEDVEGKTFIWNNESLYLQDAGEDYGNFCGSYYPYYITYIDNEDPIVDKTYTNIEFRANVAGDDGLPIKTLETWNEYQSGISNLSAKNGHGRMQHHLIDKTASLNRAYRIWRCDIPRDNIGVNTGKHPNERMRNPWLYLKLTGDNKNKVQLHDLIVDHFE